MQLCQVENEIGFDEIDEMRVSGYKVCAVWMRMLFHTFGVFSY